MIASIPVHIDKGAGRQRGRFTYCRLESSHWLTVLCQHLYAPVEKKKRSMMSRSFFSAFSQCMLVATLLYHSPGCFLCCSLAIHSWNITRLVIGEFHILLIFQVPTSLVHFKNTQCVELNKCALLVKSKSKCLTPRASCPGNSWLVHNVE